jgi:hypothetical protein
MMDLIKKLFDQPYWVLLLIIGSILSLAPIVTADKEYHWATHSPSTYTPVVAGMILLLASIAAFGFTLYRDRPVSGVDLTKVKEENGQLWTCVSGCEIRVVNGDIVEHAQVSRSAVVLPCNEYFDDECAQDPRSALGAYVTRVFEGQAQGFMSLVKDECAKQFGMGAEQQKTDQTLARSFGAGRCILLLKPLGKANPVALVSTTTQRAGEGLEARVFYLFAGIRELTSRLADERLDQLVLPVLGAGHGGVDPSIAFVGLLLAIAEAARHGRGGQRLKKVTIVVFRRDASSPGQVDPGIIRRALALIGS